MHIISLLNNLAAYTCGAGDDKVQTSINFGCTGVGSPIIDIAFAITRFLVNGVGLVIVGSLILGGIQYTISRDDPSAVAAATNRIRSSLIALLMFIFAFAFLNYIIPKGFISQ